MQNDPWSHDGEWTGPPPFLSAKRVGLTVNWCANRIGKVGFAQTDTQCASKVALAQVRVSLQKAQNLEVVFVLPGGGCVGVHWLNVDAST